MALCPDKPRETDAVLAAEDRVARLAGITRIVLPVENNGVENVNVYLIADGPRATLVDCGVWRPDEEGLLERGLAAAGYAIGDISRVIITHAHIDHYGLAAKVLERSGAELWMHAMTDLDLEKYRHPSTSIARRRDTYTDHGLDDIETVELADHLATWMPYLHSVAEPTKRVHGGEVVQIGGDDWELIHTPGHSLGHVCVWSARRRVLLSGDHLLPSITPPVTFERGFERDPLRSYLASLRRVADREAEVVLPGHGEPFGHVARRIDAIFRNKLRRMEAIRRMIVSRPCTVNDVATQLVARAIRSFQRQFAINETLSHIAFLRWSGLIERRARPDGVYEWFSISDAPIDVAGSGTAREIS
jgi:glyoxylase-like metal-dependent hydrolase (beta-lactamase superfamily II)